MGNEDGFSDLSATKPGDDFINWEERTRRHKKMVAFEHRQAARRNSKEHPEHSDSGAQWGTFAVLGQ
eukprot:GDKH01016419.1.p3 GENE.GDKH01016419.1~~GDKH01016419.1.p3  ORF type:complete len:67 (-),score=15.93 GDKH01016419.1:482-682(-)